MKRDDANPESQFSILVGFIISIADDFYVSCEETKENRKLHSVRA